MPDNCPYGIILAPNFEIDTCPLIITQKNGTICLEDI